jgi:hypothetical protein
LLSLQKQEFFCEGKKDYMGKRMMPGSLQTFITADLESMALWTVLSMRIFSSMLTPPSCCQCFRETLDARAINWQLQ